jgi:hypothetical protein
LPAMKNQKSKRLAYENLVMNALVYEFPSSPKDEAERKIRMRLKRKKLGVYDPAKVATLRKMKNFLQREIGKSSKSKYFLEQRGTYVDNKDFDIPRLIKDTIRQHPGVDKRTVRQFVPFCVFIYYLL